jgi:hypothetical protein
MNPLILYGRIYLIGVLLQVLCLSILGCSDSKPKRLRYDHFTHEGDKVHFRLGSKQLGEDFTVYKSYLKGSTQSRWGILETVSFIVLLPNYETYDKEINRYEFVERLGIGRRLGFKIIRRGSGRVSLPELFRIKLRNGFASYSDRLGKYDEIKYELEVYRSTSHRDDQYLYRPNEDIKVIIGCTSDATRPYPPSPGCRLHWDHSEFVYADAFFSLDYLPQWQEILANIEKILNGQKINAQGEVNGTQN